MMQGYREWEMDWGFNWKHYHKMYTLFVEGFRKFKKRKLSKTYISYVERVVLHRIAYIYAGFKAKFIHSMIHIIQDHLYDGLDQAGLDSLMKLLESVEKNG